MRALLTLIFGLGIVTTLIITPCAAFAKEKSAPHGTHTIIAHGANGAVKMEMNQTDSTIVHGMAPTAHDHEAMTMEHKAATADLDDSVKPGVTEHLGAYLPKDLKLTDSTGKAVRVEDLLGKPTIIAPVYYTCPSVCHMLMASLSKVLPQISMNPKTEYQILSVSFDETDSPQLAQRRKSEYTAATGENFPPEAWKFLTGNKEQIKQFMDSIGFRYKRIGKDFMHPVVVVVTSPDGKIVRYLYGTNLLPFDLNMAILEAQQGIEGLSVKRILKYCFSYEPDGKKYVFNIMRVAGGVVLLCVIIFAGFLFFGGKKTTTSKRRK
ncbi:MAG: SCO family protein [Desulfovibrio sp.]